MTKIALVTGGAGFIGSHMVDNLIGKGLQVRVVDNLSTGRLDNLKHISTADLEVDTRDLNDIESDDSIFKGVDYVFHFAGIGDIVPSIEDPMKYMDANVMATVRLLEGARSAGISRFVYAASSSCYGLAKVPTTESDAITPEYPYALSKYQGEQAVLHWQKVYGLGANSIRMFNVYGTRSKTNGAYGAVMGVFLKQKLEGKPFTVVGDGEQRRDFVYVTDVAEAFFQVAKSKVSGHVYNVGADKPQSINRLVELLGGPVTHLPKRPGEPETTWANISKISSEIGWTPQISFEDGVGKILENIDYWQEAPLWTPDSIAEATKTWFHSLS